MLPAEPTKQLTLERLPPEQARLLPVVRDEWVGIGLSTEPADRATAEVGVRLAYEAAGLEPPRTVIWTGSALAGCITAALLDGKVGRYVTASAARRILEPVGTDVGAQLAELWDQLQAPASGQIQAQLREQVEIPVWKQVWARVDAQVRAQVRAQVWEPVWEPVWAQVGSRVRAQLLEELRRPVWTRISNQFEEQAQGYVRGRLWDACPGEGYGPQHLGILGFYAYFAQVAPELTGLERLHGHLLIARSAGWWWPFARAVILTERPDRLHRDPQGRLHHPHAPAVTYPDGVGIWAWHGMRVPREVIECSQDLTVERIRDEPNVELRRVMLEQYGHVRYLRHAGAERVHADQTGTLWRCRLPGDEPLVMVELRNSTSEPDRSRRTYWLRVPPGMRTAREAVAWTFSMGEGEYTPTVES